MIRKIVLIIYIVITLSSIAFGLIYLFHNGVMPYHLSFYETSIEKLDAFNPRIIELTVALMRICGAACLAIGIGACFVIYNIVYKFSMQWIWMLFLQFTIVLGMLTGVTYSVARMIPDGNPKPPYIIAVLLFSLNLVAFLIARFGINKSNLTA